MAYSEEAAFVAVLSENVSKTLSISYLYLCSFMSSYMALSLISEQNLSFSGYLSAGRRRLL